MCFDFPAAEMHLTMLKLHGKIGTHFLGMFSFVSTGLEIDFGTRQEMKRVLRRAVLI